jgi:hypothetical protein
MMLRFLFIASGAQFYMDWLLPTNPISKNPLIRLLWGWNKEAYTAYNYRTRFCFAIVAGLIHAVAFFPVFFMTYQHVPFWMQMLFNGYPTIVQIYVGTRCWQLMRRKKKRAVKNKLKIAIYRPETASYNPAKPSEPKYVEVG